MQKIVYELNDEDYRKYILLKKIQTVSVRRQKVVIKWLVCVILLIGAIIFDLDKSAFEKGTMLSSCVIWLLFSDRFMNYIMQRQICKKMNESRQSYQKVSLRFGEDGICYEAKEQKSHYSYKNITHCILFKKLLIITLQSQEIILIPMRIFPDKNKWRQFYIEVVEMCIKKK